MFTCIYTKEECEDSAGEHVLQNSFGARWRSKRITCDKLQAEFGSTIDVEVERAFQPFRNMLGARGGRGETGPSLEAKDIDGAKYLLHPYQRITRWQYDC